MDIIQFAEPFATSPIPATSSAGLEEPARLANIHFVVFDPAAGPTLQQLGTTFSVVVFDPQRAKRQVALGIPADRLLGVTRPGVNEAMYTTVVRGMTAFVNVGLNGREGG